MIRLRDWDDADEVRDVTPLPFDNIAEWLEYWFVEPRLPEKEQAVLDRYYRSYRNYFGPYLKRHYVSQAREVEQIVTERSCRVLDVGCGCGTESIWLGLLGAVLAPVAVDRSPSPPRSWAKPRVSRPGTLAR